MVVVMLPEEGKGSFAESAKEGLNRESEGVLRISAEWAEGMDRHQVLLTMRGSRERPFIDNNNNIFERDKEKGNEKLRI